MPYKIIFMGTPDFAVPSLTALHEAGETIELVVTQPDRPKGRGRKVIVSPVKAAAIELGYRLEQPQSILTEEFKQCVAQIAPDLLVVVAFGQILSPEILDLPKICAINVHASLLPAYRGAAPIQWAIINGEKESGVTTMMMDRGLDTGDILLKVTDPISQNDTAASLHDRLATKGAKLLTDTIKQMQTGDIVPCPQDSKQSSYAPLLSKTDGLVNWDMPSEAINCFIRGMTPWPGAFTFLEKKRFKIFDASPITPKAPKPPGTVLESFTDELWVATKDGGVSILELQSASGKRMKTSDFLKGHPMPPGSIFG